MNPIIWMTMYVFIVYYNNTTIYLLVKILLVLTCLINLTNCAPAVVGVGTAAVAASSTEKGFSTSVSDSVIFAKISDKFIQEDASLITSVDLSVNDGAVLLTGKVKNFEKKMLITRLSWEVKGVKEVINEVQVSSRVSIKDVAKDVAASAQLRASLISDPDISSLNYSIDVVNGIIYLAGVASDENERNRVVSHAQLTRFTKKVINYIILSTDKRD